MKVLLQSNCALRAQMHYFTSLFPDWDVRGVTRFQADKWLTEGHEAFEAFLGEIDLFVGLTDRGKLPGSIPSRTKRLNIPIFSFSGYHPDIVGLNGIPSPLVNSNFHSRIAATAFLNGFSLKKAAELFNEEEFEALGYFEAFSNDRERLGRHFEARGGFDCLGLFDRWADDGSFLYVPPHPNTRVFVEVVHLAMSNAGYTDYLSDRDVQNVIEATDNYLADGIVWPVHKEIANRLGIPNKQDNWRLSVSKGSGRQLNLQEFLEESWAIYSNCNDNERNSLSVQLEEQSPSLLESKN